MADPSVTTKYLLHDPVAVVLAALLWRLTLDTPSLPAALAVITTPALAHQLTLTHTTVYRLGLNIGALGWPKDMTSMSMRSQSGTTAGIVSCQHLLGRALAATALAIQEIAYGSKIWLWPW
jgi:hypothetical protein